MNRRQSIYIGGFKHKNPIPNAARVGNIIASGVIIGVDPESGNLAETLEDQCRFMFVNLKATAEAGGATTDDIVKLTVWLADVNNREALNQEWLRMFPDPANRPARQALQMDRPGPHLIKCEFLAVIDQ